MAGATRGRRGSLRTILLGPVVWIVFGAVTLPFVIGTFDTRLMTPLALPGYLLFVWLTIIGEQIVPQYALWLYWAPFLGCSYVLAVVIAAGYHAYGWDD